MSDPQTILAAARLEVDAWLKHGDWHGLAALIRDDALHTPAPLLTPAFVWSSMQMLPWTSRQNIVVWLAHFHLWWENAPVTSWAHVALLVDDRLMSVERLLVTSALWVRAITPEITSEGSSFFHDYYEAYHALSWRDPVKRESAVFLSTLKISGLTPPERPWSHVLLALLHPSKQLLIDAVWRTELDQSKVFAAALACIIGEVDGDVAIELPEEVA
jgi:hypothetical protein